MNPRWFARADWPTDWELAVRAALIAAVQSIQTDGALSDEQTEGNALSLWSASHAGRGDELPRNRAASQKASEDEIARLVVLAARLAEHIDTLHRPAVDALWIETSGSLWNTAAAVKGLIEDAKHALSAVQAPSSARGAREKVEASHVAEAAGLVFEAVAGRRPTCTTDPVSGEIRGRWPAFLREVFAAIGINSSVAVQARLVSEKYRPESGN